MRILRPWQVYGKEGRTGLSKSTIRRKEQAGKFPRRIPIGENSTGWLEHEVDAWIAEQAAKHRRSIATMTIQTSARLRRCHDPKSTRGPGGHRAGGISFSPKKSPLK